MIGSVYERENGYRERERGGGEQNRVGERGVERGREKETESEKEG